MELSFFHFYFHCKIKVEAAKYISGNDVVTVITTAYLIFWGPLFLVTLLNWDWDYEEAKQSMAHEVTLHVAFVHAFVNPSLLMVLHRGIRQVDTTTGDN